VCIGDRYQIGSALFEVTQPRVTCYRVGIRTNEPRMPALLTSSGRPGFYFRVLQEGEVGAGDDIVKVGQAKERMTVAEINALLYSPRHPHDRLERALRIDALSPGWRGSFEALLKSETSGVESGNAGLAPAAAAHPVPAGFRPLAVPVVLLSAGIGATPVLAMLHALVATRSTRQVSWLHGARDRQHHPFAAEVQRLMPALVHGRSYVCYSRPDSRDKMAEDFDAIGHLSRSVFDEVGVSREADVYLCGPTRFMAEMKDALATFGVAPERIRVEIFNGSESMTPGVVGAATRAPHPPEHDANTGALVSFARSGIAAHWNATAYQSLLELAEACDVPVRWSCRTGVCHNCESGLVSGAVVYGPEPLDKPADGNLLVCCSQPIRDVVIDL
jgi:ferredoxin-NADP reductase